MVQPQQLDTSCGPSSWDDPTIWHSPQAARQVAQMQEDTSCSTVHSVPSQTPAGQQTAPRLVPLERRGALRPAEMLLATHSDTGQVLPAVQPPDVGLTFSLCTGRQQ